MATQQRQKSAFEQVIDAAWSAAESIGRSVGNAWNSDYNIFAQKNITPIVQSGINAIKWGGDRAQQTLSDVQKNPAKYIVFSPQNIQKGAQSFKENLWDTNPKTGTSRGNEVLYGVTNRVLNIPSAAIGGMVRDIRENGIDSFNPIKNPLGLRGAWRGIKEDYSVFKEAPTAVGVNPDSLVGLGIGLIGEIATPGVGEFAKVGKLADSIKRVHLNKLLNTKSTLKIFQQLLNAGDEVNPEVIHKVVQSTKGLDQTGLGKMLSQISQEAQKTGKTIRFVQETNPGGVSNFYVILSDPRVAGGVQNVAGMVGDVVPPPVVDNTTATVKMMITKSERQALADLGYKSSDINSMKPDEATAIIKNNMRKVADDIAPPPAAIDMGKDHKEAATVISGLDSTPYITPEVADAMQRLSAGEDKTKLFKELPSGVVQEALQRLSKRGLLADLDAAFRAQNYDDVATFANQMIEDVAMKGKESVYYDYINGLKDYLKFTPTVDEVTLSSKIDTALKSADAPKIPPAPEGKEVLGFIETATKSDNVTVPVKEDILAQGDRIFYEVASNQKSLDRVTQLVNDNYELMLARAMNGEKWTGNADDLATNYLVLAQRAMREGNTEIARELLFKLAETANKYGQFNQALSMLNRLTPEGQLMYVSRVIKKMAPSADRIKADDIAKSIGDQINKINNDATIEVARKVVEGFGDKIKSIDTNESGETTNQVIQRVKKAYKKKPPELQLADRIKANIEGGREDANPIKDMVNTLYQVAKEQLPKKSVKKRGPMDFISLAMNEKEKYVEVWDKAKDIVKAKYADKAEALKILDDYFMKYLTRPFSDKLIERSVRSGIKDLSIDIAQIIRQKFSTQTQTQRKLVDELMSRGWIMDPNDADEIERLINNQYAKITNEKKRQVLENMLASAGGKGRVDKTAIDRVIELTNMGVLDNERYYELVARKLQLPVMTDEMVEIVRRNMTVIQTVDDTKLTGYITKNRLLRQMYKEINQQIPRKWYERVDDYRYINMLLSPKTQLRNIVGNIGQTFVWRPTSLFWQQIGATKFAGGGRAKTNANVLQYYQDVYHSLKDAADAFKAVIKGQASTPTTSSFMDYRKDITPNMVGVLGTERWAFLPNVGRFMEAVDAFFATMISAGEFSRLKSLGMGDIDAYLASNKLAEDWLYRGFADPEETAPLVYGLDRAQTALTNAINFKIWGVRPLSWIVPFTKIANNMTKVFFDFSPVGFINAATTTHDDLLKAERSARALTGTVIMGIGAILAANGQTTWAPPKDKRARELFYAENKKPYSVKIGGVWVPVVFFGPVAFALAVPAAIHQAWVDDPNADVDGMWEKSRKTATNIFKFLSSQSYVAGMSMFTDVLMGDDDTTLSEALSNISTQLIPAAALIRYINTIIDPYYKKSGDELGQFLKSAPGGTFVLPAYTDPNGDPQERDWYNALLPWDVGVPRGEFEQEYQERMEELKQNAVDRVEDNADDEEKKSTLDRILERFGMKEAKAEQNAPIFSHLKNGQTNLNVQLPQMSGGTVLSMDGQQVQILGLSDYLRQENRNSKLLKAYLSGNEKRIQRELERAGMTPDEGVMAAIKSLNTENRAEFLYGEMNKDGFTPQMLNTLIDNGLLKKTEAEWMVRKGLINTDGYNALVGVIENRESELGILKEKDPRYIASVLNKQPPKDDTEAMNLIKKNILTNDVINKMLMAEYITVEQGAHLKQLLRDYQIAKGVKNAPRGGAPPKAGLLKIKFQPTPKIKLGLGLSQTRTRTTKPLRIESAVPVRLQKGQVSTKPPQRTGYSLSGRLPLRVRNTMATKMSDLGR